MQWWVWLIGICKPKTFFQLSCIITEASFPKVLTTNNRLLKCVETFSEDTEGRLNSIWGIKFLLAINSSGVEVSVGLKFIHFLCSAILRHYYSTVKYPFHNTLKVTAF